MNIPNIYNGGCFHELIFGLIISHDYPKRANIYMSYHKYGFKILLWHIVRIGGYHMVLNGLKINHMIWIKTQS